MSDVADQGECLPIANGDILQMAASYLGHGNLTAADALTRLVLSGANDDGRSAAAALALLAHIAELVAQPARRVAWARRLATIPAPPIRSEGPRYLVIRAWGAGFWSDVNHVLGAALLAEIAGRTPVTLWGSESRYTDGRAEDAFGLFFEPISGVTLETLRRYGLTCFPALSTGADLTLRGPSPIPTDALSGSALALLSRPEDVVVSTTYTGVIDLLGWSSDADTGSETILEDAYERLLRQYLVPLPPIVEAVERFRDASGLAHQPYLALHLRGLDKGEEQGDLEEVIARSLDAVDELWPVGPIFLLTDDKSCFQRAVARFGDRVVTTMSTRGSGVEGLHRRVSADGAKLGREVLIDFEIARRADQLVGNASSNLSATLGLAKRWSPGSCHLFGRSILHARLPWLIPWDHEITQPPSSYGADWSRCSWHDPASGDEAIVAHALSASAGVNNRLHAREEELRWLRHEVELLRGQEEKFHDMQRQLHDEVHEGRFKDEVIAHLRSQLLSGGG